MTNRDVKPGPPEAPADKGSLPASPSVPGEGHGTGVVGWQPIETAPRQEAVMLGHERLRGWFRIGICNALGEWSYDDRPWLQQDPLDETPTHWMLLPPPPAASVSMGTSRKASEPIQAVNAEMLGALRGLLPFVRDLDDCGPRDEGWQSDELTGLIASADAAIATATRNSGDEG